MIVESNGMLPSVVGRGYTVRAKHSPMWSRKTGGRMERNGMGKRWEGEETEGKRRGLGQRGEEDIGERWRREK